MKIILFDIPSYPPPIAVRNLLTNQFCPKNWIFGIFSRKKIFLELSLNFSFVFFVVCLFVCFARRIEFSVYFQKKMFFPVSFFKFQFCIFCCLFVCLFVVQKHCVYILQVSIPTVQMNWICRLVRYLIVFTSVCTLFAIFFLLYTFQT